MNNRTVTLEVNQDLLNVFSSIERAARSAAMTGPQHDSLMVDLIWLASRLGLRQENTNQQVTTEETDIKKKEVILSGSAKKDKRGLEASRKQ